MIIPDGLIFLAQVKRIWVRVLLTWNWFQVGLTCGFGFNINRIYVGLNGIVDFIPAFGYSEGDYKPKINSENVKLSVGYNFLIQVSG